MPTAARISKATKRWTVRLTEEQASLIRHGATRAHLDVPSFLVKSACMRTEEDLAEQRRFVYSEEQWAAFTAALDRPPQVPPGLLRLFS